MGAWLLTTAISAVIGGWVATLTTVSKDVSDPLQTLPVYSQVFTDIGMVTMGVTFLMIITVPLLNRLVEAKDQVNDETEIVLEK